MKNSFLILIQNQKLGNEKTFAESYFNDTIVKDCLYGGRYYGKLHFKTKRNYTLSRNGFSYAGRQGTQKAGGVRCTFNKYEHRVHLQNQKAI